VTRIVWVGVLLSVTGCGVTQVLDRAGDGTPILIRAPQPDADDLQDLHAEFGVRTVLNIRGDRAGEAVDWYEEERRGVEAIGAQWRHMKISGTRAPSPEQVSEFFDLVEDPDAWPILVHCQGGIHRTGLLSALYRIQYQGWSGEDAVEEMEDNHFNWTTRDRDALKRYLWAYQPDASRAIPRTAATGGP
jgi:protein tyrosine/serine phosphatase